MLYNDITIYTDGSCNPVYRIGGWAAIIFIQDEKIILEGKMTSVSHQRMELEAVIQAFEYLKKNELVADSIWVYSDSQYVVTLPVRKEKIKKANFLTKRNEPIRNADLLAILIPYLESWNIEFIKVQAHQKITGDQNVNREVDKIARKIIRQHIATLQII